MSNHTRGADFSDFQGRPAAVAVFALNGEYWTIGYAGKTFSLKSSKGLAYMHRLIQHPGEEFHSLDLLSGPGTVFVPESATTETSSTDSNLTVGRLGDAGEMLDSKAKQNYKRRLVELREEMEDARELGNSERVAEIESEIDFLAREISRAVGLGGRDRRAGSAAERARLNVSRSIKAARQKISEHNVELGNLLDLTIRTGSFCSYAPDLPDQVTWRFSEGPEASSEVTSAVPFISPSKNGFLRTITEGTTFVGREAEQFTLARSLEQALGGEGRIVLIGGAAGVGKTRIAAEIGAKASKLGVRVFVGSCYDRDNSAPFSPFVEILESAFAQASSPAAFRDLLGNNAAEVARLMPQLRTIFPDIPATLEVSPEQSRRMLLNAFVEFLARVAQDTPVLLLLDDLHWGDEGTLSLLSHIARSVSSVPVLIVGTFRDNERDSSGSLAKALDELTRHHLLERVNLRGLSESAVSEMIRTFSGQKPPSSLVEAIYTAAEGNPFFVEELYKHLKERGRISDSSGKFRRSFKLDDLDVPQSLRLVIGRNLACLSDETRKMLGTAAIIGRTFTFGLLEASTRADTDMLLDCVEEAEKAGVISSTLEYPEALFRFSHELIRQTVLSEISPPRRQRFHLSVAEAIERICKSPLEDQANEIADHLWQAGTIANPEKTVNYLAIAAKRALAQSAFNEAAEGYRRARVMLDTLPESPERDARELELCSAFVQLLQLTKGYSAPETVEAAARARALAEKVGDLGQLILQEVRTWHTIFFKGDYSGAAAVGDRILDLARREGHPTRHLVFAHSAQMQACFYLGDLVGVEEHFAHLSGLVGAGGLREPGDRAITIGVTGLCAWAMGRADLARERIARAIASGRASKNPYELAFALLFESYFAMHKREPQPAEAASAQMLDLSEQHGFSYGRDLARGVLGWARANLGATGEGVAMIRQALAALREAGATVGITGVLTRLSDAQALDGATNDALLTVEEALLANPDELVFRPDAITLRGKLRLKLGQAELAEADFREAIAMAQKMSAKALELRAAIGLARLLQARGIPAAARNLLAPIYGWFTEGLDTPDMKDAKSLRSELGA